MGLLTLIVIHVMLFILFEVSLGCLLLTGILLAGDIFIIYLFIRKVKRREPFIPKSALKRVSLIVNCVAVCLSCSILHIQYLSPESREIHEQFVQCSLYKSEFHMPDRYSLVIPLNVKITLITMSETVDTTSFFIEKRNSCTTEEELESVAIEIKTAMEDLQSKFVGIQYDLEKQSYCLHALVICIVLYKLLWYWTDLVSFVKWVLKLFIKYKGT